MTCAHHHRGAILPSLNPLEVFLKNPQAQSSESALYAPSTDINLPLKAHPHTPILLRRNHSDSHSSFTLIDVLQHPDVKMNLDSVFKVKVPEFNPLSLDDGRSVLCMYPRQFMEDQRVEMKVKKEKQPAAAASSASNVDQSNVDQTNSEQSNADHSTADQPNADQTNADEENDDDGEDNDLPTLPPFYVPPDPTIGSPAVPKTCPAKTPKKVSLLTRLSEAGVSSVLEYAIALGRADHLKEGDDAVTLLGKGKARVAKDSVKKMIKVTSSQAVTDLWTRFQENRAVLKKELLVALSLDGAAYQIWQAVLTDNNKLLSDLLYAEEKHDINWVEPIFHRTPFYLACVRGNIEAVRMFLQDPRTQVNATDHRGRTPYFMACLHGHEAVVRLLATESSVDRRRCDLHGTSPLLAACIRGSANLVSFLLSDRLVDRNRMNSFSETPLLVSFTCKNLPVMRLLLSQPQIDVNKPGRRLETLLIHACKEGHQEAFDLLMKIPHLDVNKFDEAYQSPLYHACGQGRVSMVATLLKHPQLDFYQESLELSPFEVACSRGHSEVVQLLLEDERFEVQNVEVPGDSPLVMACTSGKIPVVEVLLKSPKIVISDGVKLLAFLESCKHETAQLAEMFFTHPRLSPPNDDHSFRGAFIQASSKGSLPVLELLLNKAGSHLSKETLVEAFTDACLDNAMEVVNFFLTKVPNLEINGLGDTVPFTAAVESGHAAIAAIIANDDRFDANNVVTNPLVVACHHGYTNLVSLLLRKPGVDIYQVDVRHRYPLLASLEQGYINISRMLMALMPVQDKTTWDFLTSIDILEEDGRHELRRQFGDYVDDPAGVSRDLRKQLGIDRDFAAETFAILVFLCDGFLKFKKQEGTPSPQVRFLKVAEKLPLELQMILCNRTNQIANDVIPLQHREKAFKNVTKDLHGALRKDLPAYEVVDETESKEYSDDDDSEDFSDDDIFMYSQQSESDFDDPYYDYYNPWFPPF